MEGAFAVKPFYLTAFGFVTSFVTSLFGGWSTGLRCLLICMVVDLLTGTIVAAVFKKSKKTNTGTLSSAVGAKGIAKKIMILCLVLICHQLDQMLGTTVIRDAATIAFAANEILSILENAGLMGIKIPAVITKAIDVLNDKAEKIEITEENKGGK